jgi:glucuronate isomerase
VHAGVYRNHSSVTLEKFGRDTGHDIPVKVEFTQNLRPLLEKHGLNPRLNLILFCLDESTVTREIAPLASFYPSVYVGAPWWFFDSPSGLRRHRETVTDIAGFYRGSGFIDDTRAFLSIHARHDLARRVDSGYLAELVVSGRIKIEVAKKIAVDLVTAVPMNAFKL